VDEPHISTDAMLGVDDEVPGGEAAKVLEKRPGSIGSPRALPTPVCASSEDLLFGDEHEPVGRENDTASERADDDLNVIVRFV
jgi:hypothetical protein